MRHTSLSYALYFFSVDWRYSSDSFFASSLVCLNRFVRSCVVVSIRALRAAGGPYTALRTLLGYRAVRRLVVMDSFGG